MAAENPMKLNEKTVLLTGINSGLGFGIANQLSELGANVALVDKNADKLQRLAEVINDQREVKSSRGRAAAIIADLAKPHHVKEAVSKTAEIFGGIDMYVDALQISRNISFQDEKIFEELDRFVDINLKAPIQLTHEVVKFMKGRRRGRIVYLVQDIARMGYEGESLLGATRTGLIGFTKSLARELAPTGITVNCLAIGPTEEYLLARDPGASSIAKAQQELIKAIPQAKMTLPDDISGVVAFIATGLSQSITGQTIAVSGGLTMFG